MSGELIGGLAGMTVVGSLNIAILIFVFNISKGMGSLEVRVDHLEKGLADTLGARIDQFEEEVNKRVTRLEEREAKRSEDVHRLIKETRRLRELVIRALDVPPDVVP